MNSGSMLDQILLSWKHFRFQLNNVIFAHINMLEQIHAPKWDHIVIPFKHDLLYELPLDCLALATRETTVSSSSGEPFSMASRNTAAASSRIGAGSPTS